MWDYLQLARQIYTGHGFTSLFTYPIFLPLGAAGDAFPLVWRPPGFPLLVAALFPFGGGPFSGAPRRRRLPGRPRHLSLALEFVRRAGRSGRARWRCPRRAGRGRPGIATSLTAARLWLANALPTVAGRALPGSRSAS
jgi:hypothetical protein